MDETFGQALRRLRGGRSMRRVAQLAHCSKSYVGDLESGRRKPTREIAAALDQALNAHGELVALVPRRTAQAATQGADPRLGPRSDGEHPVLRRTLLSGGLTALAPNLQMEDIRHIAAALEDARRYLDKDAVNHFRRQMECFMTQDGERGPRETLSPVLGMIGAMECSTKQVKPHVRAELISLAARGAEFSGWLYRDIGNPGMADYWRDRAMDWAKASDDGAMQAYVLLRKSQAAWDERDPVRMLRLAEAAQRGPRPVPPKVRAEAAQQEARGHAMLGNDDRLMKHKLEEAQHLLAQAQGSDAPDRFGVHYDSRLLAVQIAMCYCEAGQPGQAVTIYRRELSAGSFSTRDYGYFLSLMSGAIALTGEPDEAARLGTQALRVAVSTHSVRTLREVHRLVGRLTPWEHRACVRELRDAVTEQAQL